MGVRGGAWEGRFCIIRGVKEEREEEETTSWGFLEARGQPAQTVKLRGTSSLQSRAPVQCSVGSGHGEEGRAHKGRGERGRVGWGWSGRVLSFQLPLEPLAIGSDGQPCRVRLMRERKHARPDQPPPHTRRPRCGCNRCRCLAKGQGVHSILPPTHPPTHPTDPKAPPRVKKR